MLQELTVENYEEKMKFGKTAVMFSATWCVQCRVSTPIAEQVSEEIDIPFYKYMCDDGMDLPEAHKVLSLPTILLLEDGDEIGRIAGGFSAAELSELLRK